MINQHTRGLLQELRAQLPHLECLDDEDVNLEAESQTWRPGNVPSGNLTLI